MKNWGYTNFAGCLCRVIGLGIPNAGSSRSTIPSGLYGTATIGGLIAARYCFQRQRWPALLRAVWAKMAAASGKWYKKSKPMYEYRFWKKSPNRGCPAPCKPCARTQIPLVPVLSYNKILMRSSYFVASCTILAGRCQTTGVDQWTEILVRDVGTVEKKVCWERPCSQLPHLSQDHKSARLCPGTRCSVCVLDS